MTFTASLAEDGRRLSTSTRIKLASLSLVHWERTLTAKWGVRKRRERFTIIFQICTFFSPRHTSNHSWHIVHIINFLSLPLLFLIDTFTQPSSSTTALIEGPPKKDEPFYNDMMRLMYNQCMNQSKEAIYSHTLLPRRDDRSLQLRSDKNEMKYYDNSFILKTLFRFLLSLQPTLRHIKQVPWLMISSKWEDGQLWKTTSGDKSPLTGSTPSSSSATRDSTTTFSYPFLSGLTLKIVHDMSLK